MAQQRSSITKKDVFVAWLGGALVGTMVGFNCGLLTGLNVLVPKRERADKQPVVTVLAASSGVIGLAIWGVWTVRSLFPRLLTHRRAIFK